jgi:hypothetical protein
MGDPGWSGYRFPHRADDAIWSRIGDGCPDGSWAKNEVFKPVRVVEPDGTTLVVDFRNDSYIGDFRYTLRVTKDDGRTYLELDPGGTGTNGNS